MRLEFFVVDVGSLTPEEKALGEMLRFYSEEKILTEFKKRLREERSKMLLRLVERQDQPFVGSLIDRIAVEEIDYRRLVYDYFELSFPRRMRVLRSLGVNTRASVEEATVVARLIKLDPYGLQSLVEAEKKEQRDDP